MTNFTTAKNLFLRDLITEHVKTLDTEVLSQIIQFMITETTNKSFGSLMRVIRKKCKEHPNITEPTIPVAVPVEYINRKSKKRKRKRNYPLRNPTLKKKQKINISKSNAETQLRNKSLEFEMNNLVLFGNDDLLNL